MLKKMLIVLTLILSACAPKPPMPPPPPSENLSSREATFGEVENSVEVHPNAGDEAENAQVGTMLYVGGSAQSGEDARARIDLLPEQTVIRLAPNSYFTLEELSDDPQSPFTKLNLLSGEIWIILFGGELETETSYGTASVRGSMMSVSFDPEGAGMLLTCLEGHCALENDAGKIELTEGLSASITENGKAPSEATPISEEKVEEWKQANPEIDPWLQGTPIAPPEPPPPPPPPEGENSNPVGGELKYNLTNNCLEGNWHWEFVGPITERFTLAPGESASGTLPAGTYIVTDTLEGGGTHGPNTTQGGDIIDAVGCPD